MKCQSYKNPKMERLKVIPVLRDKRWCLLWMTFPQIHPNSQLEREKKPIIFRHKMCNSILSSMRRRRCKKLSGFRVTKLKDTNSRWSSCKLTGKAKVPKFRNWALWPLIRWCLLKNCVHQRSSRRSHLKKARLQKQIASSLTNSSCSTSILRNSRRSKASLSLLCASRRSEKMWYTVRRGAKAPTCSAWDLRKRLLLWWTRIKLFKMTVVKGLKLPFSNYLRTSRMIWPRNHKMP